MIHRDMSKRIFLWCEALSAYGAFCRSSPTQIANKSFDLEFRVLPHKVSGMYFIFQTPEANTGGTQESYFQLQISSGGDAVFRESVEVAAVMGRFWENWKRVSNQP